MEELSKEAKDKVRGLADKVWEMRNEIERKGAPAVIAMSINAQTEQEHTYFIELMMKKRQEYFSKMKHNRN
jgi:uncharacterized protein YbjQ (UPF0145 family)